MIKAQVVQIIVDHRESVSGIPAALEELGANVIVEALEVGDYHVSDDVIIERKTTSDFLHSIIDDKGHLFSQLADMMREYKRSILIIEGELIDLYTSRAIDPKAINGMILAAARFDASMVWTLSVEHTAQMIYQEAEHEQVEQKKSQGSPHGKRSHMTLPQRQAYVVSSIGGGIGTTMAEALLKQFGSVRNVMNATIEELCDLEGIGTKTAENIHQIVRSGYK